MQERQQDSPSDQVLVIGPSRVGDMVLAQPLFMRLKQLRPDCKIDVLAPQDMLPVVARMPEVRAGMEMPQGKFSRRKLGRSLRDRGYNQSITLPDSRQTALVPWFAGIPRRTAYSSGMHIGLVNDIRAPDRKWPKTSPQCFVALAQERAVKGAPEIPLPRLEIDTVHGARLLRELALDGTRPAVGLMPGVDGAGRQWPVEFYAEVAQHLAAEGVQTWIFGTDAEQALADSIRAISGGMTANLCGRTSLTGMLDLVARCRAVIANESGLMQLAAASGVPVTALYGSAAPDVTLPVQHGAIHYLRLEDGPCFERTCPPGHYHCLRHVAPQTVRASLRQLAGI
ncbi:MAG: lipopolysaccharide heptosyltransferase II [Stenotrophobium sp.]